MTTENITPEDIEAAYILIQLSKDRCQNQSPKKKPRRNDFASTPLLQVSQAHMNTTNISVEEDVSEVFMAIQEWSKSEVDLRENFHIGDVVGRFSKPIKKQLMMSDVTENQSRLMLSRQLVEKTMIPLLEKSENPHGKGFTVSVYGPDGEVQEMRFIIWNNGKTPVLTSGWKDFVVKYDLKKFSDFVTVWMFRHIKTRKICFAIDSTRFRINQKLSGKIFNQH